MILDDTLLGPPQTINHILYALTENRTYYAVRETNRTVLWKYNYWYTTLPSPVFAQGVLHVTSLTGDIKAYHASDGSLLWHALTHGIITSPFIVSNGVVYFSQGYTSIIAIRAKDGTFL